MPSFAAEEVFGSITTNTIWTKAKSPYVVVQNVKVNENIVLTIEPGTEILFNFGYGLIIEGKLVAKGDIHDLIKFSSIDQTVNWTGIEFRNNSDGANYDSNYQFLDGSIIENAIIENCAGFPFNSTINCNIQAPYLNNVKFRNNAYGIVYWPNYMGRDLRIKISNCEFQNDAMSWCSDDDPDCWQQCDDNLWTYFGGAVRFEHSNDSKLEALIDSCVFFKNRTTKGGAIYLNKSQTVDTGPTSLIIENCNFNNNLAYLGAAIYFYQAYSDSSQSSLIISNSSFNMNSALKCDGGYGKGGAILTYAKNFNLSNCSFTDNMARGDGAALYLINGEKSGINNNVFIRNKGNNAIYLNPKYYNETIIDKCTITQTSKHPLEQGLDVADGLIVMSSFNEGVEIKNSNIYNNFKYNITNNATDSILAINNYWGFNDSLQISQKIYDVFDESIFGEVIFSPYSSLLINDAYPINWKNRNRSINSILFLLLNE